MEVDEWTGFTRHFTHLKTSDTAKDKTLLLTTILGRRDQPGSDQNGRVLPWHHLRQAVLAASPGTSAMKPIRRRWPSW